jgi:hypothetical protein
VETTAFDWVTVLEMHEAGGELVCLHEIFPTDLKQP